MCLAPLASATLGLYELPINEMIAALETEALTARTEHGVMLIMPHITMLVALVALLPTEESRGLRAHLAREIVGIDELEVSIEYITELIAPHLTSNEANTEALRLLAHALSAARWPYWHRLIEGRIHTAAA